MTESTNNHQTGNGFPIVGATLMLAEAKEWDLAFGCLERMGSEDYPDDIFGIAVFTWIDYVLHIYGVTGDKFNAFDLFETVDAEHTEIDEAEPGVRWALRMIAARANRDNDQILALLNSIADDEEQNRAALIGVLNIASQTVAHVAHKTPDAP